MLCLTTFSTSSRRPSRARKRAATGGRAVAALAPLRSTGGRAVTLRDAAQQAARTALGDNAYDEGVTAGHALDPSAVPELA